MKPIAITVPWYGKDIRGGAEQAARYLAQILRDSGVKVEIFTTCVKDASCERGVNTYSEGVYDEDGITVRRFSVRARDRERIKTINKYLFEGKPVSVSDEAEYLNEDINSSNMYRFIRENKDDYQAILFIPYLYGLTYNGVSCCPDKAILIPCFHDEGYAYMEHVRHLAEKVKGIIFLSHPEEELAGKLFNLKSVPNKVLGIGIDDGWEDDTDPDAFRKKFNIKSDFIMYAGRKDPGKKVDELIDFFGRYVTQHNIDLKLVPIGGGKIIIPPEYEKIVCDLGYVDIEDKRNAYAASKVFINPSRFESFSIVIMEAWLNKKPVIVSGKCDVTKKFCIKSNGGLFYEGYSEFEQVMDVVLKDEGVADTLGKNGYEFVKSNYSNRIIAEKYLNFIENCMRKT